MIAVAEVVDKAGSRRCCLCSSDCNILAEDAQSQQVRKTKQKKGWNDTNPLWESAHQVRDNRKNTASNHRAYRDWGTGEIRQVDDGP